MVPACGNGARVGVTRSTEYPPQGNPIAGEQRVEDIEEPSEHWPPYGSDQPAQTHQTVCLSEHLDPAHNTAVGENAVHDPNDIFMHEAIA